MTSGRPTLECNHSSVLLSNQLADCISALGDPSTPKMESRRHNIGDFGLLLERHHITSLSFSREIKEDLLSIRTSRIHSLTETPIHISDLVARNRFAPLLQPLLQDTVSGLTLRTSSAASLGSSPDGPGESAFRGEEVSERGETVRLHIVRTRRSWSRPRRTTRCVGRDHPRCSR